MLRKLLLKLFNWCPGVEAAVNFTVEKKDLTRRAVLYVLAISIVIYGGAYALYISPDPLPEPLVITIDDVDVSNVTFSEYNFSNFYPKKVEFEVKYDNEEYAPPGTNDYLITVYEFTKWGDAFDILNTTQTPEIVIEFAKWLGEGTRLEVAERYYGSIEKYENMSLGYIGHYFGTPVHRQTCRFEVLRSQEVFPIYYELGTGEYIEIEKRMVRATRPMWCFAVSIDGEPPYKAIWVRFVRQD